ncbi:DUF1840 domain-containing protein [Sphaerotilus natans]|uniref:DUF1840 domain-containing protein n=1 Tax=Sphaerotilus natans TaxID=34103 RepID=UPI00406BE341
MLYKFRSKASGDVIMTSEVGDRLMRLLGREPAPQGIFQPTQMPELIRLLEAAVHDEEEARRRAEAEAAAEGRTLPAPKGVSLRQRVWPLVDMLRRCAAEDKDIVWGV